MKHPAENDNAGRLRGPFAPVQRAQPKLHGNSPHACSPTARAEISPVLLAPANENWPIVECVAVGNGVGLARTLVRVLVRRALLAEGVFSVGDSCDDQTLAG